MARTAKLPRCILCNGRQRCVIGMFFPKNPALYGGKKMIGYTICRKCLSKPGAPSRAEEHMLNRLSPNRT